MSRMANFPDSASPLRICSLVRISRCCFIARAARPFRPAGWCRAVRNRTPRLSAARHAPANRSNSISATTSGNSHDRDRLHPRQRNTEIQCCNVRQFGHVSSRKSSYRRFRRREYQGELMIRLLVGMIGLGALVDSRARGRSCRDRHRLSPPRRRQADAVAGRAACARTTASPAPGSRSRTTTPPASS